MKRLQKIPKASFLLPLFTLLLIFVWTYYTDTARDIDIPSETNLLQNGSFEEWSDRGPAGWSLASSGSLGATISETKGFVDEKAGSVSIEEYSTGSAELSSTPVQIDADTTYFFKAYYVTDAELTLKLQFTYQDGTKKTKLTRFYPDYDYDWSSMSTTIRSDRPASVSAVIVLASDGYVTIDGAYVIKKQVPTKQDLQGDNLFAAGFSEWSFGNLSSKFSETAGERTVLVSDYQGGEAKWLPDPTAVDDGGLYGFELTYRSTSSTVLYATFIDKNGNESYQFLEDSMPSIDWTTISTQFEVPEGVNKASISLNLYGDGAATTKDYRIVKLKSKDRFEAPLVSITFDDGWLSSYENGARIIDEFSFPGVFYLNPSVLGSDEFMTEDQIKDLLERGHQLGSHGDRHIDVTAFSTKLVNSDLIGAYRYLSKLGLGDIDFASPYGKHDELTRPIFRELYRSHRGTDFGINTKLTTDINNLKALFIRSDTTEDELQLILEQAATKNGWLILIYHEVDDKSDSLFGISVPTFQRHMEIIRDSGIDVVTVSEALNCNQVR